MFVNSKSLQIKFVHCKIKLINELDIEDDFNHPFIMISIRISLE